MEVDMFPVFWKEALPLCPCHLMF